MKMIAATKFRRGHIALENTRAYGEGLSRMLARTTTDASMTSALAQKRKKVIRIRALLFTSDRGLCGSFNSNVIKATSDFIAEKRKQDIEVSMSFAGRRGHLYFEKNGLAGRLYKDAILRGTYEEAENMARDSMNDFLSERVDEVHLIFNYYRSVISQVSEIKRLLPVSVDTDGPSAAANSLFEPEANTLFEKLLIQSVRFEVYQSLLHSLVSEHATRMTAMDNATNNAGELIDQYTLQMNRARQTAITRELIEIISGAESLKT